MSDVHILREGSIMGALCELFAVGAEGHVANTSSQDALVEATLQLAAATDIPLSPLAARTFTAIYRTTIGNFLETRGASHWTGKVREFALKRIRRVGEEASRVASIAGESEISAASLVAAANAVIQRSRLVETRLAGAA